MNEMEIPTYDVQEVTLEEAILLLATDEEKLEANYKESSERLLKLCA
ncbi:MAG: hypothetical protein PVJ63_08020 [Thioalkalispiraceae bacterium]|jgi:hypothetical protein